MYKHRLLLVLVILAGVINAQNDTENVTKNFESFGGYGNKIVLFDSEQIIYQNDDGNIIRNGYKNRTILTNEIYNIYDSNNPVYLDDSFNDNNYPDNVTDFIYDSIRNESNNYGTDVYNRGVNNDYDVDVKGTIGDGHISNEMDYNEFKEGSESFSLNFLNELALFNYGHSVATSPFSVLYLLAQLALYTEGQSHEQLIHALNLQGDEQIRIVFTELTDKLNDQESVRFTLAARTYVTDKYNLSESFLNDTETVFGASAETVNFDNPDLASENINSWVEKKTNDLITDLVRPNMFNENTVLVLVDAVYFKGNWTKRFNSAFTEDRDFYINEENTTQIPTMYQRNTFSYVQNAEYGFQIVSLPFEGRNFSLNIILPSNITGLPSLLSALQNTSILNDAYQSLEDYQIDLFIPKMEINTEINLKEILTRLGINDIFSDNSGIKGILQTATNLTVTSGVQKAVFKVNEIGAEAAAANAITIGIRGALLPEPSVVFRADRPFIYLLVFEGLTVFCGVFEG